MPVSPPRRAVPPPRRTAEQTRRRGHAARAALRRREPRRKGAAALADAGGLDFGRETDNREIGVLLDRAQNGLVERERQAAFAKAPVGKRRRRFACRRLRR